MTGPTSNGFKPAAERIFGFGRGAGSQVSRTRIRAGVVYREPWSVEPGGPGLAAAPGTVCEFGSADRVFDVVVMDLVLLLARRIVPATFYAAGGHSPVMVPVTGL
jgi:hypothetical protein